MFCQAHDEVQKDKLFFSMLKPVILLRNLQECQKEQISQEPVHGLLCKCSIHKTPAGMNSNDYFLL